MVDNMAAFQKEWHWSSSRGLKSSRKQKERQRDNENRVFWIHKPKPQWHTPSNKATLEPQWHESANKVTSLFSYLAVPPTKDQQFKCVLLGSLIETTTDPADAAQVFEEEKYLQVLSTRHKSGTWREGQVGEELAVSQWRWILGEGLGGKVKEDKRWEKGWQWGHNIQVSVHDFTLQLCSLNWLT